jgi:hypothetical protein
VRRSEKLRSTLSGGEKNEAAYFVFSLFVVEIYIIWCFLYKTQQQRSKKRIFFFFGNGVVSEEVRET